MNAPKKTTLRSGGHFTAADEHLRCVRSVVLSAGNIAKSAVQRRCGLPPLFAVFNMPPVCSPAAVGEGCTQTGINICLNKFGFIATVLDEESVPLVVSDKSGYCRVCGRSNALFLCRTIRVCKNTDYLKSVLLRRI